MSSYSNRQADTEALRKALVATEEGRISEATALAELTAIAKSSPEGYRIVLAAYNAAVEGNRSDVSAAIEKCITHVPNAFGGTPEHEALRQAVINAPSPIEKSTDLSPKEKERVEQLTKNMLKVRNDIYNGGR